MLSDREKDCLANIVKHCVRIEEKTGLCGSFDNFMQDCDVQEIISFNLLQIGELAKKLSDDFVRNNNKEIPWELIRGMRNRIAHGYDTVDLGVVWNTAVESVPLLRGYCLPLIEQ